MYKQLLYNIACVCMVVIATGSCPAQTYTDICDQGSGHYKLIITPDSTFTWQARNCTYDFEVHGTVLKRPGALLLRYQRVYAVLPKNNKQLLSDTSSEKYRLIASMNTFMMRGDTLILQGQQATAPLCKLLPEPHKTSKLLRYYTYGLSAYAPTDGACEASISKRYGFVSVQKAGCVVKRGQLVRWKRHNARVSKTLNARYGEHWQDRYHTELLRCGKSS